MRWVLERENCESLNPSLAHPFNRLLWQVGPGAALIGCPYLFSTSQVGSLLGEIIESHGSFSCRHTLKAAQELLHNIFTGIIGKWFYFLGAKPAQMPKPGPLSSCFYWKRTIARNMWVSAAVVLHWNIPQIPRCVKIHWFAYIQICEELGNYKHAPRSEGAYLPVEKIRAESTL